VATHLRFLGLPIGLGLPDQIEIFFVKLRLFLTLSATALFSALSLLVLIFALVFVFVLIDNEAFSDLQ
jgi:hypothetical protein